MKKLLTMVALMVAAVFSCTGCSSSLFSDESTVKFGDTYTHTDPKDLTYDDRIVLKSDSMSSKLEDYVNSDAYPDTMMYDDRISHECSNCRTRTINSHPSSLFLEFTCKTKL